MMIQIYPPPFLDLPAVILTKPDPTHPAEILEDFVGRRPADVLVPLVLGNVLLQERGREDLKHGVRTSGHLQQEAHKSPDKNFLAEWIYFLFCYFP